MLSSTLDSAACRWPSGTQTCDGRGGKPVQDSPDIKNKQSACLKVTAELEHISLPSVSLHQCIHLLLLLSLSSCCHKSVRLQFYFGSVRITQRAKEFSLSSYLQE